MATAFLVIECTAAFKQQATVRVFQLNLIQQFQRAAADCSIFIVNDEAVPATTIISTSINKQLSSKHIEIADTIFHDLVRLGIDQKLWGRSCVIALIVPIIQVMVIVRRDNVLAGRSDQRLSMIVPCPAVPGNELVVSIIEIDFAIHKITEVH